MSAEAKDTAPEDPVKRRVEDAAARANAEAAARRKAASDPSATKPQIGRGGEPDPVRYGDWEKNGIASDF
jgi:hypothetical protein